MTQTPWGYNEEILDPSYDQTNEILDEEARQQKAQQELEQEDYQRRLAEAQVAQKQEQTEGRGPLRTEADDNHEKKDAKEFGLGENIIEARNAIAGGGMDAYGSMLTFPERVGDLAAGEDISSADYEPDWDPMGELEDPITKTWWGGILREISKGVTYGATAVLGAAPLGGATAATTTAGVLVRSGAGAAFEGIVDEATDKADANITRTLVKHVPQLDGVLGWAAAKDTDHPLWIKFKNTAELIGITEVADWGLMKIFGSPESAAAASKNIREQTVQKGIQELDDEIAEETALRTLNVENQLPGQTIDVDVIPEGMADDVIPPAPELPPGPGTFRGHKNKPMADRWQGSPSQGNTAFDVMRQSARNVETPGGSTNTWTTPAQAERMARQSGLNASHLKKAVKDLLGDKRFEAVMKEIKKNNQSVEEVFQYAFQKQQEVMGRAATAVDSEDFWKPIMDEITFRTGGTDSMEAWAMENVVAADLVNAELFSQIRDAGIAAREISGIADLMDTDGPMKVITDRLQVGLMNVKRSRYLISSEFRKLKGPAAKKAIRERMEVMHAETKKNIEMMIEVMVKSDDPQVAKAFAEYFSKADKIANWDDLDAFMRNKRSATGFLGEQEPGIIVRELGAVMINSILSGPKTLWRAAQGTASIGLMRPIYKAIGGGLSGNSNVAREGAAELMSLFQSIPDSFKILRKELDSSFAGDISQVSNRFMEGESFLADLDAQQAWMDMSPNIGDGDRLAHRIATITANLNSNRVLSGIPRAMGAVDQTTNIILARARARGVAMRRALNDVPNVDGDIGKDVLNKYQDEVFESLLDADGKVDLDVLRNKDPYLVSNIEEATLRAPLTGMADKINTTFEKLPLLKPFFLFARTGVNGLNLSYKATPVLGMIHKEFVDVVMSDGKDFTKLARYGISNAEDLAAHRAMLLGRQSVGMGVVMTGSGLYLGGNLTGNGPRDRQLRQRWIDDGWQPRSIKIAGKWVGYDSWEPYNILFGAIADVGDNMRLMGPQWAEDRLGETMLAVMSAPLSKSYLSGLSQLNDLANAEPGAQNKIVANIFNNQIPLAGLRSAIGKTWSPAMKEVNSGLWESIANRNGGLGLLPKKYDLLNGKPLRDWNIFEAFYDAVSPIPLRNEGGPGRTMLQRSNFDLKSVGYSYNGVDLTESDNVRSMFQEAFGSFNIEEKLNNMAGRSDIKDSMALMEADLRSGKAHLEPMNYPHNQEIKDLMAETARKAWAKIQGDPEVQALVAKKTQEDSEAAHQRASNQNQIPTKPGQIIMHNK